MAIEESRVYLPQAPRPRFRLLEDERWLAFVLLVPTMVLLGLFIAYPFVRGILLSVTMARVRVSVILVFVAFLFEFLMTGGVPTSAYHTFVSTGVPTGFDPALVL